MTRSKALMKVLSLVATGAMAFGMVLPVVAEGEDETEQPEAWISKTYNTAVEKAEKFSFTVTQNIEKEGLIHTAKDVTIDSISFDGKATSGTETKRSQVKFPTYTEAGQYEYTVTESKTTDPTVTKGEHEKLIMSEAEYTVDVYVADTNDNKVEISNIIVNRVKNDAGTKEGKKITDIGDTDTNDFKFTNTYTKEAGTGENPGTDYTKDGSFNVTKTVNATNNGNVDSTKAFSFTATFNLPEGTDADTFGGIKGNDAEITTLNSTGDRSYSCTFELTDGKNMKFTGLPVGTSVSVTESATPNYKGSYELILNGGNENKDNGGLVTTGSAIKYNEEIGFGGNSSKLGIEKNTADFTNLYNYVPATGIIMNSLPYVMMFGVGAIALVLYVSSKHRKMSD